MTMGRDNLHRGPRTSFRGELGQPYTIKVSKDNKIGSKASGEIVCLSACEVAQSCVSTLGLLLLECMRRMQATVNVEGKGKGYHRTSTEGAEIRNPIESTNDTNNPVFGWQLTLPPWHTYSR